MPTQSPTLKVSFSVTSTASITPGVLPCRGVSLSPRYYSNNTQSHTSSNPPNSIYMEPLCFIVIKFPIALWLRVLHSVMYKGLWYSTRSDSSLYDKTRYVRTEHGSSAARYNTIPDDLHRSAKSCDHSLHILCIGNQLANTLSIGKFFATKCQYRQTKMVELNIQNR